MSDEKFYLVKKGVDEAGEDCCWISISWRTPGGLADVRLTTERWKANRFTDAEAKAVALLFGGDLVDALVKRSHPLVDHGVPHESKPKVGL